MSQKQKYFIVLAVVLLLIFGGVGLLAKGVWLLFKLFGVLIVALLGYYIWKKLA